jgi:hypothetical protein
MKKIHFAGLVAVSTFFVPLLGCDPTKSEEVDGFRSALPLVESVRVDGPESDTGHSSQGATDLDAPYATYYKFTRKIRDDVNAVTGVILGSVWYVAHTTPTEVTSTEALWGPYTDSLEPSTYRFRITKSSDGGYRYTYEGRPKTSTAEGDFRVIVEGLGYAKSDERHGDGHFTIDLDVSRELDPVEHEDDSGVLRFEHDLPKAVGSRARALPRHIEVDAARSDGSAHYSIVSDAFEDQTGTLLVQAVADLDPAGTTKLETVTAASQWNELGEGRSDVSFSGGDVPAPLDPVSAVECWNSSFKRSYYHDSAGIEADYGELSACAFDAKAE